MSRPSLIVLAFIVATYVTNLFSKPAHGQQQQQEYSDLTGGLLASNEDSQSSQEEQQQTQSLQSILSKLIPSVWAEKPKREPPPPQLVSSTSPSPSALAFAATRPKSPPSSAAGINGHGNVSSGTDNVGSGSEQQSAQVQQAAYVTPADRDYATTISINSLDSGYWASNGLGISKQQLAAPYDSYTGPSGAGDHHQNQHQSGWHSNRYFATPSMASPSPPPSPARQVISVNSNRLFYPPPPPSPSASTSLNQQQATAIEQQSSNQQQINLPSYSNNPPVPLMTTSQYSPLPFWSPQSQSGPTYSLDGNGVGGLYNSHQPSMLLQHQQVSPVAAAAYHHQLAGFNPAVRGPNHHHHPYHLPSYLVGLPPTLSESSSHNSISSSPPQPQASSSIGSSLLASLATNKADITNLIKLLPLIAQTVSMLPRVLNPSISNSGGEIDTRTQFEPASNGSQKPAGPVGGTSAIDPASSLSSQTGASFPAWGSQAASLIKAFGSLALASAQQQQQQQQSPSLNGGDPNGGTLAGFMSRWPAGASLIGALLRNAAASWWPAVVSRAQEVEFVANRSRLRNQATDHDHHYHHHQANTINLDTQTQASQTTKQPRQQAFTVPTQKVGRIP